MGMPVSSYSYFYALSNFYYKKHNPQLFDRLGPSEQGKIYALKRITNKLFEPYNLFAFIIHDPIKHKEFADNLQKQFLKYHRRTGKNLLFFALTQPPELWQDEMVQPEYYKHLEKVFQEEGHLHPYYNEISENLFNDSFNVKAIASALNIPYDQLPAIVITTHPSLWSFQWYRTCTQHMGSQLEKLTILANDLHDFKNENNSPRDIQEKMFELLNEEYDEELNLCEGKGNEFLTESLATAFSELLSFIIDSKIPYSQFSELAKTQVDFAMTRVIEAIHLTKAKLKRDEHNQEFLDTLDELCEKVGTFISLMHSPRTRSWENEIYAFEEDSNQLFMIGKTVGEFLQHFQKRYPSLDFTPAAICLAKAFEIEINKSIVHWIRKMNNIVMPNFYNKVQPDVDALITPNIEDGIPIDFNKSRKNGTWHPPAMGQSYLIACKNLEKQEWTPYWLPTERKLLLREWDTISKIRNDAAHSEKVSPDSLDKLMDSIQKLEKNKIFMKMASMREEFRGSNTVEF
jgi:hypothetical protein